MPDKKKAAGFTLMEITIVIFIMGMFFFFAVPIFYNDLFSENRTKVSKWISIKASNLKNKAITNQINYVLNIEPGNERMWISNEQMTEKEIEYAKSKGFILPSDFTIEDVEYPDGSKFSSKKARIIFNKQGYCSKAIIHIRDSDGKSVSYLFEPFIDKVREYEYYASFED